MGNGEMERKTKIVCTIGPATSSEQQLRSLIEAGMNVARLNFSHGDHESHGVVIDRLRALSEQLDKPIAILQDLAGPKVRVGSFADGFVELETGDLFTLTTRAVEGDKKKVSVNYAGLPGEVSRGDRLLLADGTLELTVEAVSDTDLECRVVTGGKLSSRKGVNCPSGLTGLSVLQEKDLRDLEFGLEKGVDYVGLSFVRTAQDVQMAKREIADHGANAPVIAKIETQLALRNFAEILKEADGIIIARGDLSIETPFSEVPVVQKQLIARANRAAKPVITATQMLWSMVHHPQPSRAEVADVANAIMDGSDAIMLSDETTVGKYPVRAVKTMDRIARDTERSGLEFGWEEEQPEERVPSSEREVARVGCELAEVLGVDLIGTITMSGETARFAASHRPTRPILAATPNRDTYRRLSLVRGVEPILFSCDSGTADATVGRALDALRKRGWSDKKGVFISRDRVRVGQV